MDKAYRNVTEYIDVDRYAVEGEIKCVIQYLASLSDTYGEESELEWHYSDYDLEATLKVVRRETDAERTKRLNEAKKERLKKVQKKLNQEREEKLELQRLVKKYGVPK